ncbi:MAG TPA: hypothetical protein V6C58_20985 [Allocoleopsis sp.]
MPKTVIPLYISLDRGNRTTQFLNPRIDLDREKQYLIKCINMTSFFTYPNIFEQSTNEGTRNNTLNFNVGAQGYTITFLQGLYDIDSFNDAVSRELVNLGLSSTLIVFSADGPTQRVVVQLNSANVSINFGTSLCADILGFTAHGIIGPGNAGIFYYSDETANFNRVIQVLVHCSLAQGFYNNTSNVSSDSDVISSVIINASPGAQIQYDPNTAISCYLTSNRINDFTVYLTDQDGRDLIVDDPWSVTFEISED